MDFIAIDVETANPDVASICQVGIAAFLDREIVDEWQSLVDPQDWFSPHNVAIHGITADMVRGAPAFAEIVPHLHQYLDGRVVVSHTPFDRIAIHRAFDLCGHGKPQSIWLDSARVARRTWKEVAKRGYGLANVCQMIGYEFTHHNALEDAKAAGQIILAAMKITGLSVQDWLRQMDQPRYSQRSRWGKPVARPGNPDGPLYGEVLVFTGQLRMPREKAAEMAARLGCEIADNVTRRTTILVIGDQGHSSLDGRGKSTKLRRAEQLIAAGQPLRILTEADFLQMVNLGKLLPGA
ncbi:MAG TPA: transposase [Firmicutes bacterium]|nr:transposase [Bacillota bacterium]